MVGVLHSIYRTASFAVDLDGVKMAEKENKLGP